MQIQAAAAPPARTQVGQMFRFGFAGNFFRSVCSCPVQPCRLTARFHEGAGRGALRGLLPLAALMRSLFVKATGPNRAAEHKKKIMKTEQTQNQKSDEGSRPARAVGHEQTQQRPPNASYSLLPTPPVSGMLKATSAGRPVPQAFFVKGERPRTHSSKKKDYENKYKFSFSFRFRAPEPDRTAQREQTAKN